MKKIEMKKSNHYFVTERQVCIGTVPDILTRPRRPPPAMTIDVSLICDSWSVPGATANAHFWDRHPSPGHPLNSSLPSKEKFVGG
jgi:hypothetical protein